MKREFAAVLMALALVGCSSAKSTTIPTDPSKWDTLASDAKRLSDDDRRLFASYLVRMGAGSALSESKVAVPPGTTIGDAIKDQQKFEADEKIAEAKAAALKAKADAERARTMAKLEHAATVVMTDMTLQPKDIYNGRFNNRLAFVYAVDNHTPKGISGIKGTTVFRDQFGTEIERMGLSMDEDIAPSSMRTISGYGKDLNEFEDSDQKLAVTPFSKLKVTFEPEMIVFSDGSKLNTPEFEGE